MILLAGLGISLLPLTPPIATLAVSLTDYHRADAIILVTNVGRNPSIQGTSLSVINKNTDSDGIALKDKLFVFGNQLDTANNEDKANGNKDILIKDVEKYNIGERKRVFVGSALKYLVDNKIIEKEYKTNFYIGSGIENIGYQFKTRQRCGCQTF